MGSKTRKRRRRPRKAPRQVRRPPSKNGHNAKSRGSEQSPSIPWGHDTQQSLASAPKKVNGCASARQRLLSDFQRKYNSLPPRKSNAKKLLRLLSTTDGGASSERAERELLHIVQEANRELDMFAHLETQAKRRGYRMAESDVQEPILALICKHSPCADYNVWAISISLPRPSLAHIMRYAQEVTEGHQEDMA